jgi:hypothetical protein
MELRSVPQMEKERACPRAR